MDCVEITHPLEVSIDEPLNVDWDGNELLLSDILGTDEDVIYRDIETEVEKKLLMKAIDKLSEREKTIINLRFPLVLLTFQPVAHPATASRKLGFFQIFQRQNIFPLYHKCLRLAEYT